MFEWFTRANQNTVTLGSSIYPAKIDNGTLLLAPTNREAILSFSRWKKGERENLYTLQEKLEGRLTRAVAEQITAWMRTRTPGKIPSIPLRVDRKIDHIYPDEGYLIVEIAAQARKQSQTEFEWVVEEICQIPNLREILGAVMMRDRRYARLFCPESREIRPAGYAIINAPVVEVTLRELALALPDSENWEHIAEPTSVRELFEFVISGTQPTDEQLRAVLAKSSELFTQAVEKGRIVKKEERDRIDPESVFLLKVGGHRKPLDAYYQATSAISDSMWGKIEGTY
ncbi:hypothetical protein HZC07_03185 [Candidatus Micrarchaeota archaeon]|nr:hypothetical protein [Candidatus Micrarchaeota archaeon]